MLVLIKSHLLQCQATEKAAEAKIYNTSLSVHLYLLLSALSLLGRLELRRFLKVPGQWTIVSKRSQLLGNHVGVFNSGTGTAHALKGGLRRNLPDCHRKRHRLNEGCFKNNWRKNGRNVNKCFMYVIRAIPHWMCASQAIDCHRME